MKKKNISEIVNVLLKSVVLLIIYEVTLKKYNNENEENQSFFYFCSVHLINITLKKVTSRKVFF